MRKKPVVSLKTGKRRRTMAVVRRFTIVRRKGGHHG